MDLYITILISGHFLLYVGGFLEYIIGLKV